jgi:hypothetical protein
LQVTCGWCQQSKPIEDMVLVDARNYGPICQDCLDFFARCDGCQDFVFLEDISYQVGGVGQLTESFCISCRPD